MNRLNNAELTARTNELVEMVKAQTSYIVTSEINLHHGVGYIWVADKAITNATKENEVQVQAYIEVCREEVLAQTRYSKRFEEQYYGDFNPQAIVEAIAKKLN